MYHMLIKQIKEAGPHLGFAFNRIKEVETVHLKSTKRVGMGLWEVPCSSPNGETNMHQRNSHTKPNFF